MEAHIADVIDQLRANREEFIDLASKYGGTMQLVAKFNSDYPSSANWWNLWRSSSLKSILIFTGCTLTAVRIHINFFAFHKRPFARRTAAKEKVN
jgi:hypothetical protein